MALKKAIQSFLKLEAASGILLLIALLLILIVANSPLNHIYHSLLSWQISLQINDHGLNMSLEQWVNDGLMTFFFLLLALEIKREILVGELSNPRQMLLPMVAAIGGVLVPAGIYLSMMHAHPGLWQGWAVPTATDIALSLGLIALLGNGVPVGLKIFLMALAIVDDLIAILIIAIFYSSNLSLVYLAIAGAGIILLLLLNYFQVKQLFAYTVIGLVIWWAILYSGIHATLAGVLIGLCIPHKQVGTAEPSLLELLEQKLHPWVSFLIVPIFVLANAGVVLTSSAIVDVNLIFAIATALFLGKQLGIFAASYLIIKSKLAKLPSNTTWTQLYGVAVLAGVGFTMSLFISNLAFTDPMHNLLSHKGILLGSGLSAVLGLIILHKAKIASNKE